jgi:hypothetical protein
LTLFHPFLPKKFETVWNALSKFKYPQWQVPLDEAILEFDAQRLPVKIQIAEKAIHDRLQALTLEGHDLPERQALTDAQATLEVLRRRERK